MTGTDTPRTYKVVLFGATGFTGRLTAEYLARKVGGSIPWAIAGRNRAKLEEIKRALVAIDPACAAVAVIEASVDKPESLAEMAKSTRVVITTVGPYARYGEPVVKACVEASTDYVDITGEPDFVSMTIERYGAEAKARGLRIVSTCGFDSIPHDLGALFTVNELPKDVPITVEGFVRGIGGFSGGTWHSAINAFGNARHSLKQKPARFEPTNGRKVKGMRPSVRYVRDIKAWACPLPTIDPQVVLRSASLVDRYGPDFRYAHYARIKSTVTLVGGAIAVGGLVLLAQAKPTRDLLLKVRDPGDGPSEEQRARSKFSVIFIGSGGGKTVRTEVSGGDPGYTETSKMVAESALCLALDRERLPEIVGVIPPAAAMGEVLIDRLRAAGIRFEVIG
ncbi:MAG: saccharopine dehydrogenase NADP-binding domain-containing protein [Polyangiaceae bacterium]